MTFMEAHLLDEMIMAVSEGRAFCAEGRLCWSKKKLSVWQRVFGRSRITKDCSYIGLESALRLIRSIEVTAPAA